MRVVDRNADGGRLCFWDTCIHIEDHDLWRLRCRFSNRRTAQGTHVDAAAVGFRFTGILGGKFKKKHILGHCIGIDETVFECDGICGGTCHAITLGLESIGDPDQVADGDVGHRVYEHVGIVSYVCLTQALHGIAGIDGWRTGQQTIVACTGIGKQWIGADVAFPGIPAVDSGIHNQRSSGA